MKTIFFVFLLTAAGLPSLLAEEAKIIALGVQSDVKVIRGGQSQPVTESQPLEPNDVLRTGPNGRVDVIWKDRLGYRLLGSSECALESTEKQDMKVHMREGDIIVSIEDMPKGGEFSVSTPTAVVAVRGTQFWGRIKPQPGQTNTTFAVRRGGVDLTPKGEKMRKIRARRAADISEAGDVRMRKATQEELQMMEQADDIPIHSEGEGPFFGDDETFEKDRHPALARDVQFEGPPEQVEESSSSGQEEGGEG